MVGVDSVIAAGRERLDFATLGLLARSFFSLLVSDPEAFLFSALPGLALGELICSAASSSSDETEKSQNELLTFDADVLVLVVLGEELSAFSTTVLTFLRP
jgi:hypothetical protein